MTPSRDILFLGHILEAIGNIKLSMSKVLRQDFEVMKDVQDACIRRIEIIGEAVKNISQETKDKYPEIKWKEIAGTRDRIIHSYFSVDLDVVWDIIRKDLPVLEKQLKEIIK